ncbi:MAG: hypothetical protein CMM25_06610 [Rhodospirillaceae bacterium]|nr:hypothetical protein [Rhodospirillaceae bacterium]
MKSYIKVILLVPILVIMNACSAYKTSQDALNIWYPSHNYYSTVSNEVLQSEASENIVDAKLELAMRLMAGEKIATDPERAFSLVLQTAQNGDPRAQYLVGAAYATGSGTTQSQLEAINWYKKSALGGYDFGQYWYAFMLSRGYAGSPKNWKAALPWFEKAAEQGNKAAQFTLGEIHESCKGGVDRNFNLAAKWYRIAGENNSMGARYNLRRLIDIGLTEWKPGDAGKPPEMLQPLGKVDTKPCRKDN